VQGVEVFAAMCDVATFVCALILALSKVDSVSRSVIIGKVMICTQVPLVPAAGLF
jgi:hypothetical protein